MKRRTRKSLSYRIRMWYYRLTFADVVNMGRKIIIIFLEILMAIVGFGFLVIFPALFH